MKLRPVKVAYEEEAATQTMAPNDFSTTWQLLCLGYSVFIFVQWKRVGENSQ